MSQSASFYKLSFTESETVAADANPLFRDAAFDPLTATMLAQELAFYPGYRLVEIVDRSVVPHTRRMIVHKPGHAIVLNWTNAPVYALNKSGALNLTDDTVADYVRFFYQVVHGQHGRFTIVEAVADIPWHEDPPPAVRKSVGRMIQPVQSIGQDKHDTFALMACIVYRSALFRATVKVDAAGHVTLHDQELLVEDMPVRDDVFGQ